MDSYQDIYPSNPLIRSGDKVRKRASELLSLEYFEAASDSMPVQAFPQHHILINLKKQPHRLENWRDGEHRDFTFRQNDIVVTPAGIQSGWRWHATSKCIVITLDPDKLESFTQSELGILLTQQQLLDLPLFQDEDITHAAQMLLDALRIEGASSDVMFESLARVFLVKLINKYGEDRSDEFHYTSNFTARHYKHVLDFVANHFGHAIQIEDMAKEIGMSSAHFSRLFKKVIGDSPYQFLMRYRVEQAAQMITHSKMPLFDIALNCGFSDQAHLTRVFKQYFNVTPKAWQKQHT